jgi:hypothetical protein
MAARQINDGQAAMGEGDAISHKQAGIVGAAMPEGVAHAGDRSAVDAARRMIGDGNTADSTH